MCGRYALWEGEENLQSTFAIDDLVDPGWVASWNVAPSQSVPVIMERYEDAHATTPAKRGQCRRQLRGLTWGFVPSWAKAPDRPMINARAETLTEKASFRVAARKRRCLVPANGYYEWQVESGGKQPWFLSAGEGDPPLGFAGVYEAWREGPGAPWLRSVAIVTRAAPDALGHIHDRCPVVVPSDLWGPWLDPDLCEDADVRRLLGEIPAPGLHPRRVSRAVGNVRNNDADLVAPIG